MRTLAWSDTASLGLLTCDSAVMSAWKDYRCIFADTLASNPPVTRVCKHAAEGTPAPPAPTLGSSAALLEQSGLAEA